MVKKVKFKEKEYDIDDNMQVFALILIDLLNKLEKGNRK